MAQRRLVAAARLPGQPGQHDAAPRRAPTARLGGRVLAARRRARASGPPRARSRRRDQRQPQHRRDDLGHRAALHDASPRARRKPGEALGDRARSPWSPRRRGPASARRASSARSRGRRDARLPRRDAGRPPARRSAASAWTAGQVARQPASPPTRSSMNAAGQRAVAVQRGIAPRRRATSTTSKGTSAPSAVSAASRQAASSAKAASAACSWRLRMPGPVRAGGARSSPGARAGCTGGEGYLVQRRPGQTGGARLCRRRSQDRCPSRQRLPAVLLAVLSAAGWAAAGQARAAGTGGTTYTSAKRPAVRAPGPGARTTGAAPASAVAPPTAPATVGADGQAAAPAGAPAADRRARRGGQPDRRPPLPLRGRPRPRFTTRLRLLGLGLVRPLRRRAPRRDVAPPTSRATASRPRQWITIYANNAHTYLVVAGLRFDTCGRHAARHALADLPRPSIGLRGPPPARPVGL